MEEVIKSNFMETPPNLKFVHFTFNIIIKGSI